MLPVIKTLVRLSSPRNSANNGYSRLLCSSYSKDLVKSTPPPSATTTSVPDILMQNLKHAKSVSSLLQMVGTHQKIMNSKHILQALRTIFTLQKHGNSGVSMQQILKDPNFEKLCFQLKKNAGIIEINDTIEALKIVTFFGLRSDSTIIQVLLQLIRHNLNNLSLNHIIFTDFLLSQHSSTPMIEALKMGLPLVFEIHCPKKMDRESISHLAGYLQFAAKHKLSETCLSDIANAILDCQDPLDPKTAKSIIWSITDLPVYEFLQPVMQEALSTIAGGINCLEFNDVETTLSKVLDRVSKRNYFYDETFVDACIYYAVDKNIGYTESVFLAKKTTRLGHFNKYLMDYICKKIHDDPNLILKRPPMETYALISSLSLTDIRPLHWDSVRNVLDKVDDLLLPVSKDKYWLKHTCSLCSLDLFRSEVLKTCLQEDYLGNIFSKQAKLDYASYLAICQSIKLNRSDLLDLIPEKFSPEKIVQYLRELKSPFEYPLEASLHVAFGGEKYVRTNMLSKRGSLIDHVIVFRCDGYPVAIESENGDFVEDISISGDHQIITIIGLTEPDVTINTRHKRSMTSIRSKSLEAEGYSVVAIDLAMWSNLPEFERIPFLIQAIKDKSSVDFSVSLGIGG